MTSFWKKKLKIIFFSPQGGARELKLPSFDSESKTTSGCTNSLLTKNPFQFVFILPIKFQIWNKLKARALWYVQELIAPSNIILKSNNIIRHDQGKNPKSKTQLTIKIGYAYQWARLNFHGISDCSLLTDLHQQSKNFRIKLIWLLLSVKFVKFLLAAEKLKSENSVLILEFFMINEFWDLSSVIDMCFEKLTPIFTQALRNKYEWPI